MKNIFRLSILFAALVCSAAACSNEELDTAQYSGKQVRLVSYGPNPVMRGGALTFIGSNLDKIVEVDVPGVEPLTQIEVVSSGKQSEIRVVLPAEGPEVGKITLKSSDGKVFTTATELEYTEPIVLDKFTTAKTPAMPGDEVKLQGDYMNLVMSVTFEGGAVAQVKHIDRHNASVIIPSSAITGKIVLSDEGEIANLIYSENEIQIGDPTVSSVKASAWKPNNEATISGTYLDMIKEVQLEGFITIESEGLVVSKDGKTLTFTIPHEMRSGDINAVSYAGKSFKAGTVEMVVPTGLKAAPLPVKAGAALEVSGKDLDVVSFVEFPSAGVVNAFEFKDGKISATVPATATEGNVKLKMANGDEAEVAFTLVKPVVTKVSPTELMAGEAIVVEGTDLDLISSATLGGKAVEIADGKANEDGTRLVLTTTASSVSGKIVLTQFNGETVTPDADIKLSYDSFIVVNELPSAEHIGATVTLKGENFMMIENIFIGEAKVVTYTARSDKEISFIMPYNTIGTYDIVFKLLNGDTETCPSRIGVLLEQKFITAWEGSCPITWNDGGRVLVPAANFLDVKAGSKMRLYYTYNGPTWCQAQLNYGDWSGVVFPEIGKNVLVPQDIFGWDDKGEVSRCTEVTLTREILDNIQAKKGDAEEKQNLGFIIQGSDITFTKIEIVQEIPQEKTIWKGSFAAGNWSGNQDLAWGGFDWSTVKAGQKLIFTLTQDTSQTYWQFSLRHGDGWGELPEKVFEEMTAGQTRVEVVMTQTNLDDLIAKGGMVITGCNFTLTEVAVL